MLRSIREDVNAPYGACGKTVTKRHPRGVSLIEMVVVLAITSLLAVVAQPLSINTVKRDKELRLKAALHEIRQALDRFHRDWKRENGQLLGPHCNKDRVVCNRISSIDGYPKRLEYLLRIEWTETLPAPPPHEKDDPDDAEDPPVPQHKQHISIYLREIPIDPMTGNRHWGLRCFHDPPILPETMGTYSGCTLGRDIYDLYTFYSGVALDGSHYRLW